MSKTTTATTLCHDGKRRKGPLYRAWVRGFEGQIAPTPSDTIIYEYRPNGNLVGELPMGARPMPNGECGTLDRRDGGDPFEAALFTSPSGRVYVVERQV